jgi:hypothetical protein
MRPCGHLVPTRDSARPFSQANGLLGFYIDEDAQLIRIFDIIWIG